MNTANHPIESSREIDLLPYQRAWVDLRPELKVWDADRRIGASTAALAEALDVAAEEAVLVIVGSLADVRGVESTLHGWGHFTSAGSSVRAVTCISTNWPIVIIDRATNAVSALRGRAVGMGGRPGLVVLDNASAFGGVAWVRLGVWLRAIARMAFDAKRVAVVGTGLRGLDDYAWESVVAQAAEDEEITLVSTTVRDALADGLGRRVCRERGIGWSGAWESGWLSGLRDLDPEGKEWRI